MSRYNRLIIFIYLVLSLPLYFTGTAQTPTTSPYSRFGVGDLGVNGFAKLRAMGGIEAGIHESFDINYGNPASLADISLTTYEIGGSANLFRFQSTTQEEEKSDISLSYFAFAYPVKLHKWALGFGLIPYSDVGYTVNEVSYNFDNIRETHIYEGSGGLNRFYITSGNRIFKNFRTGINVSYLFGTIEQERRVEYFDPTYLNSLIRDSKSIGWFNFDIGFQYTIDSLRLEPSDSIVDIDRRIKFAEDSLHNAEQSARQAVDNKPAQEVLITEKQRLMLTVTRLKAERKLIVEKCKKTDWQLTFGLTGTPEMEMHASRSYIAESFKYSSNVVIPKDTIESIDGESGRVLLPWRLGAGFALKKGNQWLTGADFSYQHWNNYSSFGESDSLGDSWRISTGVQYTPNDRAIKSYMKSVRYRAGFHYSQTQLQLRGEHLNETGASFGMGFPIKRVATYIQATVEGGVRGTTDQNLLKEKYLRITIAFTLNDRWFVKQKLD